MTIEVVKMQKIMIVEDDSEIQAELSKLLQNNGYQICFPITYESIVTDIEKMKVNLVLLDINLPVKDGFTICSEIRCHSKVPVIFLTARRTEIDELSGIALGGDDFITKPYNPAILLARIDRVLQRMPVGGGNSTISYKDVLLDIAAGQLVYQNHIAELTKTETKIMFCLFANSGNVTLREKIIDTLWNNSIFIDDNTLSVNITRIREKLATIGLAGFIITKRGRGYLI